MVSSNRQPLRGNARDYVLSHEDYAALGEALREAEERLLRTRPPLSYRTIVGLRLLLLTGARMQEILQSRPGYEPVVPAFEKGPSADCRRRPFLPAK